MRVSRHASRRKWPRRQLADSKAAGRVHARGSVTARSSSAAQWRLQCRRDYDHSCKCCFSFKDDIAIAAKRWTHGAATAAVVRLRNQFTKRRAGRDDWLPATNLVSEAAAVDRNLTLPLWPTVYARPPSYELLVQLL